MIGSPVNKYDQQRKNALVKKLGRAKEEAENARLYLTANDRDLEEIANVSLAIEHIGIALEHLGIPVEA